MDVNELAKELLDNPIETMNQVLNIVAEKIKEEPSNMITSKMLFQLTVISVDLSDYSLVLLVSRPNLKPGIVKRKDKILSTIKRFFPQVTHLTIVSTNDVK